MSKTPYAGQVMVENEAHRAAAYANSKLAQHLHAVELQRRIQRQYPQSNLKVLHNYMLANLSVKLFIINECGQTSL